MSAKKFHEIPRQLRAFSFRNDLHCRPREDMGALNGPCGAGGAEHYKIKVLGASQQTSNRLETKTGQTMMPPPHLVAEFKGTISLFLDLVVRVTPRGCIALVGNALSCSGGTIIVLWETGALRSEGQQRRDASESGDKEEDNLLCSVAVVRMSSKKGCLHLHAHNSIHFNGPRSVVASAQGRGSFFPTALVATHNINIIVPVCTSRRHCRMYI